MSDKKKKGKPSSAKKDPSSSSASDRSTPLELPVSIVQEQLTFYKTKCQQLTTVNESLQAQLNNISQDQNDALEYLQSELKKAKGEIEEYKEQSESYQHERDKIKEESSRMVDDMRLSIHDELQQWKDEHAKLKLELDQLQEFRILKDQMTGKLHNLESSLDDKEREFKDMVHVNERKMLQEKTLMKKEMISKVNEFAVHYRDVSDRQMAETTKKAIRENMAIKAHLYKMTSRLSELISENERLRAQNKRINETSASLDQGQQETMRKYTVNQKFMRVLIEKLKDSDSVLEEAVQKFQEELDAMNLMGVDTKRSRQLFTDLVKIFAELAYQSGQSTGQAAASFEAMHLLDEIQVLVNIGNSDGRVAENVEMLIACAKKTMPKYNHNINKGVAGRSSRSNSRASFGNFFAPIILEQGTKRGSLPQAVHTIIESNSGAKQDTVLASAALAFASAGKRGSLKRAW